MRKDRWQEVQRTTRCAINTHQEISLLIIYAEQHAQDKGNLAATQTARKTSPAQGKRYCCHHHLKTSTVDECSPTLFFVPRESFGDFSLVVIYSNRLQVHKMHMRCFPVQRRVCHQCLSLAANDHQQRWYKNQDSNY